MRQTKSVRKRWSTKYDSKNGKSVLQLQRPLNKIEISFEGAFVSKVKLFLVNYFWSTSPRCFFDRLAGQTAKFIKTAGKLYPLKLDTRINLPLSSSIWCFPSYCETNTKEETSQKITWLWYTSNYCGLLRKSKL